MNAKEKRAKQARRDFQEKRRLKNFKKKNYKPYKPILVIDLSKLPDGMTMEDWINYANRQGIYVAGVDPID